MLFDSVGTKLEADKGWRYSKGSASPSATNDSLRAPVAISDRKASGNNAGIRAAWQSFLDGGKAVKRKRKGWRH